ncbi:MAG: NupC/NupG family nucleoside CNT transporter [Vulcanimicrobiota bacterium]
MYQLVSGLGVAALLAIAYVFSENRKAVSWRLVAVGTGLQFLLAGLVLKTSPGRWVFAWFNDLIGAILGYGEAGTRFVFSEKLTDPGAFGDMVFAFKVLPTIIFFSAMMSVLYYLGVMQWVVAGLSRLMMRALGTSGAETLSCAANIFVGQTEAPLLIRPYVERMTRSELMTVMTGGFATVAGGVMAAYVAMLSDRFPSIAGHLMAASVMSAPAALVMAKILIPETEEPATRGEIAIDVPVKDANVIEAAAAGASDGVSLALNVAGMLVAFIGLVALADGGLHHLGLLLGYENWNLSAVFSLVFYPFALLLGVPPAEAGTVARLLGQKVVLNEFYAYSQLSLLLHGSTQVLSERSVTLVTYALCGFSNYSSIGIQIAGIGGIAPGRRSDLARLGLAAMLAGNLACLQTACVTGVLVR